MEELNSTWHPKSDPLLPLLIKLCNQMSASRSKHSVPKSIFKSLGFIMGEAHRHLLHRWLTQLWRDWLRWNSIWDSRMRHSMTGLTKLWNKGRSVCKTKSVQAIKSVTKSWLLWTKSTIQAHQLGLIKLRWHQLSQANKFSPATWLIRSNRVSNKSCRASCPRMFRKRGRLTISICKK